MRVNQRLTIEEATEQVGTQEILLKDESILKAMISSIHKVIC